MKETMGEYEWEKQRKILKKGSSFFIWIGLLTISFSIIIATFPIWFKLLCFGVLSMFLGIALHGSRNG